MKLLSRVFPLLLAAHGVGRSALVAEWHMNESGGTIADSSGNNLTGTPTPFAVSNNGLAYAKSSAPAGTYGAITVTTADAARFGSSIQFNRAGSGMFQIGNPAAIGNLAGPGPAGAFTVMAWVNASVTSSTNQRIFATGNPGGWGAGLSNVDQVLFTTFGVADQRSSNRPSSNNVWQHVAYVWNAGALEVFVNGISQFTSLSGFNNETIAQYGIGGNGNGGDHFNGRIDELKIYDTALSKAEIVAAALPAENAGPLLVISPVTNLANNGGPQSFGIPFSNGSGAAGLTLSSVTIDGADAALFTVEDFTPSAGPGAAGTVNVRFTPAGPRVYQARLVLASNDGISPVRTSALSVAVFDPTLKFSPQRLDFGALAANPGIQTMSLTLTNEGATAPLEINGAAFLGQGGNGFSIVSYPDSIAPGESGEMIVSFDPGEGSGGFSDLLYIDTNAGNTPAVTLPVVADVSFGTGETPVNVINGSFNADAWNSLNGTSPAGWTNSLAPTHSAPSFYGQDGALTPGLTSIAAHFQWVAGYYEQNLSAGNPGLTAGNVNAISVVLDKLYRNDAYTNGAAMLRVSLWDKTNDYEIVGRDLVFEDPGVGSGNVLTPAALQLSYDSSTYGEEEIALRISRVSPLRVNATLVIDNVSVTVDGDWVPETGYPAWILTNGLDGSAGKENGLADDPDANGVSNFQEFAFGGNPVSGGSGMLSAGARSDTDGNSLPEWILTVAVREDALFSGNPVTGSASGVNYTIEGSAGLLGFAAAVEGPLAVPVIPATLPAVPPAGYQYRSFRLAGSDGLTSKGFLRAKASTP